MRDNITQTDAADKLDEYVETRFLGHLITKSDRIRSDVRVLALGIEREMEARSSERISVLKDLLREAIEAYHVTDTIRNHVDPTDKTGWNVKGIETCADPLCVDALKALGD